MKVRRKLTNVELEVLALVKAGMRPHDMAKKMKLPPPTLRTTLQRLRGMGLDVPIYRTGPTGPHKESDWQFEAKIASFLHLLDLKRAGHTSEHYRRTCEVSIEADHLPLRALRPDSAFSLISSPAAMCEAS